MQYENLKASSSCSFQLAQVAVITVAVEDVMVGYMERPARVFEKYLRYYSDALSIARSLTNQNPEDLVQDVYLKLLQHESLDSIKDIKGYLFIMIRNQFLDLRKKAN